LELVGFFDKVEEGDDGGIHYFCVEPHHEDCSMGLVGGHSGKEPMKKGSVVGGG